MWCWPGAETQSTQREDGNSTSECGVMLQRGSNHTHAASAEHMLKPLFTLLSTLQKQNVLYLHYELCRIHHGCTNGQKYVDIPIFRVVLIPLAQMKVNLNATSYSDISYHYVLPTVWVRCFLAKHSNVSVHRVRSIQKVCVEELD